VLTIIDIHHIGRPQDLSWCYDKQSPDLTLLPPSKPSVYPSFESSFCRRSRAPPPLKFESYRTLHGILSGAMTSNHQTLRSFLPRSRASIPASDLLSIAELDTCHYGCRAPLPLKFECKSQLLCSFITLKSSSILKLAKCLLILHCSCTVCTRLPSLVNDKEVDNFNA
jgi:hypothetical protein